MTDRPPLQIAYKKTQELVPYAKNARTHSDAQIEAIGASVREFGFTNPILVDEHSGIIAGHGRVLAAAKLGLVEVPTITLRGLSELQRRAYVLADNRLALDAGWDAELLRLELGELAEAGYDTTLTGFAQPEIDALLASVGEPDSGGGQVEEDTPPEPPKNPITKLGDVWQLGRHRLVCGDCGDQGVLVRLLDGRRVGLMVTDPPYGVQIIGGTHNPTHAAYQKAERARLKIQNDALTGPELEAFLRRTFGAVAPALSPGASWYVWHAGTQAPVFWAAAALLGGGRHSLVWLKPRFAFGRADYHYRHELCLYGWTEGAAHTWLGGRKQTSVFEVGRDDEVAPLRHPTVKPVELYAIPIRNHLGADGALLDPFAGSGPAFSAAEQLGRTAYGIELSPAYCDVIVERWQALTKLKAERRAA